jgi:hypothetical protein
MVAVTHCLEDKCAWYVSEEGACAVKVIAVGNGLMLKRTRTPGVATTNLP